MPKPLDKPKKKWYHIYIIGDTYALFACKRAKGVVKRTFQTARSGVWRKFRQSEVLCYEKVQQSSCNAVSYHHCSGSSAYQCAG